MAEERVIKIVGDTSDADKKVKSLADSFDELSKKATDIEDELKKATDPKKIAFLKKELKKVNDELGVTEKTTKKVGKSTKKANKSVGLLSKGFKNLGVAIKTTGIGLVVSLVVALGAAFSRNQKFMDAFNTVTETAGIILSQVASALISVYESVSSNSENFDALGKVLKGILTIAVTPLKLAFFGIKLGIQQAQLSWEKSFFGGKDKDKIKELTLGILETKEAIFDTGKDAVDAGSVIVNNFSEAITETTEIAKKTQTELSKINVKNAIETAKNNVQIRNTAKLAVAEQGRLVEIFDRQAEKQRQIRDEERNTIQERIDANNKLAKVLEEQEKSMLKQADAQIASAQADLNKNDTIENQVALIDALANKEGVLAQVEGFRSEQLVNDLSLKREQIELDQKISDAEKERQLAKLDFDAEQELTELGKLKKQKERLELENEIFLEDLERKRELYKEGTLARVEAEQEYLTKKLEIDNKIKDNEVKSNLEKEKSAQALEDAKINIAQIGLGILGQLAKKGSAIAKGVAVAQAGISTYQGINKALAETTDPTPTQSLRFANAAAVGVAGLLNVRKILSTNESGAGGLSASGSNNAPSAPSFNLVQGTGSNQIAETIGQDNKPVQAYVVGSNVTTQQEADRRRVENSSL